MEKSRAIELLKLAVPIKALTQQEYSEFVEAVNMGMDALAQPTSPDTIDRQQAIDALMDAVKSVGVLDADDIKTVFDMLPSAQPEPKEGHWIPHESPDGGEQYECSRCGVLWEFNDGTPEDNEAYFCPKCGKKLITK